MNNQPSIDEMIKKVDSKYTLVVVSAKRGRDLMNGTQPLVNVKSNKPVTLALNELNESKLFYERTKAGIK